MVDKFKQSGLGDLAASWIGTGENKSITPDQVTEVLGKDKVAALAQQAGIPESEGATVLSKVLPSMVDKMTPEGEIPEPSKLGTLGKVLLGGIGAVGAVAAAKAAASYFGDKDDAGQSAPNLDLASNAGAPPIDTSGSVAPEVRTYTVASGDSLSKIAKQFYGDLNQWQRIFDANRDIISNPDLIHPGQKLRIP